MERFWNDRLLESWQNLNENGRMIDFFDFIFLADFFKLKKNKIILIIKKLIIYDGLAQSRSRKSYWAWSENDKENKNWSFRKVILIKPSRRC